MLFFSLAASSFSISCARSSCLLERAQSVAVCADKLRTFRAVWFHLYRRMAVSWWPLAHAHIWNINNKAPSIVSSYLPLLLSTLKNFLIYQLTFINADINSNKYWRPHNTFFLQFHTISYTNMWEILRQRQYLKNLMYKTDILYD